METALSSEEPKAPAVREKFAAYGFEISVPDDWRIEFNAKNRRERGDVAFHSPKNNVFFVSWGKLEEALKRFHNLNEQRDETVKRVKGNPNVAEVKIENSGDERIGGHVALVSHLTAKGRRGFMGRGTSDQEVWSIHMHCPNTGRYYVIYWHIKFPGEYPDFRMDFLTTARTMVCHH